MANGSSNSRVNTSTLVLLALLITAFFPQLFIPLVRQQLLPLVYRLLLPPSLSSPPSSSCSSSPCCCCSTSPTRAPSSSSPPPSAPPSVPPSTPPPSTLAHQTPRDQQGSSSSASDAMAPTNSGGNGSGNGGSSGSSVWYQKSFSLPAQARGAYLVTQLVEAQLAPQLARVRAGLLHVFVQHTSCALALSENWDADVRRDMSDALDRLAPEDARYRHSAEGPDDMPAHIKSALIGASVTVPITNGRLALGTWQGIWYLEFRAARHTRHVVATVQGELMS